MRPTAALQRLAPWALSASCLLLACRTAEPPSLAPAPPSLPASRALFTEVARESGLDFVHGNGAFGLKWLPETMGSGCAFWDYDGDGDPDVLLLSGRDWPGHPTGTRQTSALYRNDGGRFTDVTEALGLDLPTYAIGATYGDFDGDGDSDLFVSAVGPNRLFRNEGDRFVECAESLGLADPGFGSSATWLDHDRDGDLDLFVLNYVVWSPETDVPCSLDGQTKSYCTPESYPGASPLLYRNDGGRFVEIGREAGVHDPTGKGLGVAVLDYDGDGWDDVFVANDTQPNFLFRSERDGTFSRQGVLSGVAFDMAGHARGAMGVDAGDFEGTGRPGLVIGNFSNEMVSLYCNRGAGRFEDLAPGTAVGRDGLHTLAFGTFFFDFDLDGRLDIFIANGHVESDISAIQPEIGYAQTPHLFRNLGGLVFEDAAPETPAFAEPLVARGAAYGDYDGDGDLDVLVNTVAGRARLFRNDGADGSRSLRVRLEGGAGSNRDGFGARVEVLAEGRRQVAWLRSGQSYGSQSERVLTFGLGGAGRAETLSVSWPSGKVSRLENLSAGTSVLVREAEAR